MVREISDYAQILRSKNGSKNSLNLSREQNQNGSHTESVPFKLFQIQIRERPHSCLFPLKSLFDLDRQFTQKLKYSDFNDPNVSCIWTLFWTSKFEHSLRSLKPLTDLDLGFCRNYLDPSVEGRFSMFLANYNSVSTWYE